MDRDLEKLYGVYQSMKFQNSMNENSGYIPRVRKGDSVIVKMNYFQNNPEYPVRAYDDSWFDNTNQKEMFSFLQGGDMMMIAEWNDEKWISH